MWTLGILSATFHFNFLRQSLYLNPELPLTPQMGRSADQQPLKICWSLSPQSWGWGVLHLAFTCVLWIRTQA